MYPLFTVMVIAGAIVADFYFLTNSRASVLMALGSVIVIGIEYGESKWNIGGTEKEHWEGLMLRWRWYKVFLQSCVSYLVVSLLFIVPIYFIFYAPKGYAVNVAGIALTLLVMLMAIFLAHVFGTRRGFQVYAAR